MLLAKDARFAPVGDVLRLDTKQTFFDEHLVRLQSKRRDQLAKLFAKHTQDDQGTEQLEVDPDSVLAHLRNDPAFDHAGLKRFVGEDAGVHRAAPTTLAREFAEWNAWRQQRARAEFDEMLLENAFVDFWGRLRKQKEQQAEPTTAVPEDEEADPDGVSMLDMATNVDLAEMEAVLRVRSPTYPARPAVPTLCAYPRRTYAMDQAPPGNTRGPETNDPPAT